MEHHYLFVLLQLALIFVFVIAVVAIANWRRVSQQKLWHETARIALEKGQPLPEGLTAEMLAGPGQRKCGGNRSWGDVKGGMILIGVGTGVYLAIPGPARLWGYVPMFIGVAMLAAGLIGMLVRNWNSDDKGPSSPA